MDYKQNFPGAAELRIVGGTALAAGLRNQMDDSEEPKWINILKDNNSEENQLPRIQLSEHLLLEAVLVPQPRK